MKQVNSNTDIRKEAIKWWHTQNRYDKCLYFITFKEKHFTPANNEMQLTGREIENIYKAEHPSLTTENKKEDDSLRMAYQSADQQDWENKTGTYTPEKELTNLSVGHTVGEWSADGLHLRVNGKIVGQMHLMSFQHDTRGRAIPDKEGEANALRIVTCVNGWDKLQDENKQLKEVLGTLIDRLHTNWDAITSGGQNGILTALTKEAKAALQQK